jgi:nitrate reductase gamma subunit
VACAVPALLASLLGQQWSLLLLVMAAAPVVFLIAFVLKLARWLRAPVPFRVPLVVGQQQSLPSIAHARLGCPRTAFQVVLRVVLDVLLFRPLFRTTPSAPSAGRGLGHGVERSLWLFAVLFHGSLLIVLLRHLRLFLEPVPSFVVLLENFDVATSLFLPKLHVTSVLLPLGLALLLGRRLVLSRVRYVSIAADYFPLFLLLGIATTGILMRHVTRTDVLAVKQLATHLVVPARADLLLLVHLFLVGLLLVYYPLGKLMHMPGALLSPTLTMASNNRERRHVNVRNPEVETMHYADYEATFRERMIEAGLPVEEAPKGK